MDYYYKKEFIHILFSLCDRYGLYYEFDEPNMLFACQHQGIFPSEFYKELKYFCEKADIPKRNIRYGTNNIFAIKLSNKEV